MHCVEELSWESVFGPRLEVTRTDYGHATVAVGADMHVRGWALCYDGLIAERGEFHLGMGPAQPLWYGVPRPDIAAKFARPEIVECGFDGTIRVPDRCGSFDVSLQLLRHDGETERFRLFTFDVVPGTPDFPARLRDGEMTFAIDELRGFPGDGLRGSRLPMGSIAIVTGSVRARDRRNFPAMVYGNLIEGVRRCAVGGRNAEGSYEFTWRFQTAERYYGRHTFSLSALTSDRTSYGTSRAYEFESVEIEKLDGSRIDEPPRMPAEIVRVGKTKSLRVGDPLFVKGWAVDLDFPSLVIDAVVRIDGGEPIALESRQYRSDVAERFGLPEAAYCGFVGTLQTHGLAAGTHRAEVSLVARFGDRFCETDGALTFDLQP